MNIPNRLTVGRLICAPLFFIAFFLPEFTGNEKLSGLAIVLELILFVIIEATDLLDGIIARKNNWVTDLGKVMDPFADTVSRLTYFICLSYVRIMPIWAFAIILWREFSILFLRMLMMRQGKAVAANIWGKSKAVLYAVCAILAILYHAYSFFLPEQVTFLNVGQIVLNVLFGLAAFASLASFMTYLSAIMKTKALDNLSR